MTCIYKNCFRFLRKQSSLSASSCFSFRFVLQESIGLFLMGFECPSANFKRTLHKTCFCLYCFKKPIHVSMSREATTNY